MADPTPLPLREAKRELTNALASCDSRRLTRSLELAKARLLAHAIPCGRVSLTVLLVEDDEGTAGLLCTVLRDIATEGVSFEIAIATTLAEARELLSDGRPDVILLDLGLPDSDGIETLRAVRCLSRRSGIVVLTGGHISHTEARANGASSLLRKSVCDVPEMLDAIMRAVLERPL